MNTKHNKQLQEFTVTWEDKGEAQTETFPYLSDFSVDNNGFREYGENAIQITRAEMYEAPAVKMAFLSALATRFGTTDIDVENDIRDSGCETCDYGSLYGAHITIRNITQNYPK